MLKYFFPSQFHAAVWLGAVLVGLGLVGLGQIGLGCGFLIGFGLAWLVFVV